MGSSGCLIVLLTLVVIGGSEKPVTCDAGQFAAGQTASVTCRFGRVVTNSSYHLFVLQYPFNSSKNFSGNTVLRCSQLDNPKPHCDVSTGYRFNSGVSDQMTVTIPVVTEAFAGRYLCQFVPPDGGTFSKCNLTVVGTVYSNTTETTLSQDDLPTLQQPACTEPNYNGVILALLAVILGLLIIVGFSNIMIIWKLHRKSSNWTEEQAPLKETTTQICYIYKDSKTQTDLSWKTENPQRSVLPSAQKSKKVYNMYPHIDSAYSSIPSSV